MLSKINVINKIKNILPSNIIRRQMLVSLPVDTFENSVIDIHSRDSYPSCILSNFCKSIFKFDGVKIKSMEGFLQSLKTPDVKLQRKICKQIGINAKNSGNVLVENGYDKKFVYWKGKKISRHSEEYQELLKKVYRAKFEQDPMFKKALEATKGKKLIHSIGKNNPDETILTENEFISLLEMLRDSL